MAKKDKIERHLVKDYSNVKKVEKPKGAEMSPSIQRHINAFNNNKMNISRSKSAAAHSFVPPHQHVSQIDKASQKSTQAKQAVKVAQQQASLAKQQAATIKAQYKLAK